MISCKEYAQAVKNSVKNTIIREHLLPTLAIVSVGDDPASAAYVKGKLKDCAEVGIVSNHIKLNADISQKDLEHCLSCLDEDGVILQLPLPKHLNADKALKYIYHCQDVDGLTEHSSYTPCTARGIHEWLKANTELEGKHVVIINRSNLVGKPLAKLLTDSDATVTLCHSKTRDLPLHLASADIVVTAVGKPHFINADMCKSDVIIVDVGINRVDGHLVGDVDPSTCTHMMTVTPVPGGVGLLTRAFLMQNVVDACIDRRRR